MDDKLGSHWQFLPMPQNMRQGKDVAGNYHYRQCIQGNFFPGKGNFYLVVPPSLKTGNTFGCTSFVLCLYRLIIGGKLNGVTRVIRIRQTDGGSDNVGWVTFAVHCMLVREGAVDQLDWIRLLPGHSHNEADAVHHRVLQVFYPKGHVGPGCASPWEFHQRIVDGLKEMNGGFEMLWQLTNFDFEKYFKGTVTKDFSGFRDKRWWRFQYDPNMPEHCYVKVTYKAGINDEATSDMDEWLPRVAAPPGSARKYITDPKGIRFMESYVDVRIKPKSEPWKAPTNADAGADIPAPSAAGERPERRGRRRDRDDSGWQKELVQKGVLDTAAKQEFKKEHVHDWEALFNFHDRHTTADSVPQAPINIAMKDGRGFTLEGMPVSWPELLSKLRRLPRPHLAPEGACSSGADSCSGAVAGCGVRAPSGKAPAQAEAAVLGQLDESLSMEMRLALGNGVTGIGRPRSTKVWQPGLQQVLVRK